MTRVIMNTSLLAYRQMMKKAVRELIDFVRASKRGICGPAALVSTAEDVAA